MSLFTMWLMIWDAWIPKPPKKNPAPSEAEGT